jgi:putative nucleotidyltransferase with HDIG domain
MRPGPSRFLTLYVTGIVAAALLLLSLSSFDSPARDTLFWNSLFALIGLAMVSEAFSLQLRIGTATSSVVFIPELAAVVLLGPGWAMAVAGLTNFVGEAGIRRKSVIKVLHNVAKEVLAVGVAGMFYLYAGGVPSLFDPAVASAAPIVQFDLNIAAFIGATLIYFIIDNGATATAVTLSGGAGLSETWNEFVGKDLLQNVLASSLAPLLAFLWMRLEVLGLLLVVAPLFFVRHALRANLQLEQANRELLDLMVKSIEARDPNTSGHSVRVATYAKALAQSIGLAVKEVEQIETAALMHDVGKIYEEFAPILRKDRRMDERERQVMRTHPIRSAELVGTISSLRGYVQQCVRSHHERYDGAGYPDGLPGELIPLGARIIMLADTADAMMSDRPYRRAMSYVDVLTELDRHAGTQFDPRIVEAFKRSSAIRRLVSDRAGAGQDIRVPAALASSAVV